MARLDNTYSQSCCYCHQDYIPAKRGTQRFCSDSCRSTYCRKKKAGTLGRLTKLSGPKAQTASKTATFAEAALASATGALAANAVSQTAEYFAVTRCLEKKVDSLTALVEQLISIHISSFKVLGKGQLEALQVMGVPKDTALKLMNLPSPTSISGKQRPQTRNEVPQAAALNDSTNAEFSSIPLDLLTYIQPASES